MYKCGKFTIQVHKNTCFVLIEVTFFVYSFYVIIKISIFSEVIISSLVAKFTHFNLAAKLSAVNLLISVVVIYFVLSSWSAILFLISPIFVS